MRITWFEDFSALVETGSFSRAADRRNVAQPAFSRRIRMLEEWIGVTLFERDHQPIRLTDAGRQLMPIADNVVHQIYQGRENIQQSARGANTMKFAATHTISTLFFPEWFQSVSENSPEIPLNLESHHMDTCARHLTHGLCHFMLCITHPDADLGFDQSLFDSVVVGADSLVPVSAPDANGAPLHALPGTPDTPVRFLYFSESSALGQIVDAMLAHHDGPVYVKKDSSSPLAGALKSMAESGLGVTWSTGMLARMAIRDGSLVQAGDDSWCIPVEIRMFRSRSRLPAIAENFWQSVAPIKEAS
jgi:DNA-binding transcriptional LysR family regulator